MWIDTECIIYIQMHKEFTRAELPAERRLRKDTTMNLTMVPGEHKYYSLATCSCCRAAYARFAALQIRPLVKRTCYSIPSQVFS